MVITPHTVNKLIRPSISEVTQALFSPRARRELWFSVAGSIAVALAETFAVLLVSPLLLLLTTDTSTTSGRLGQLSALVGNPTRAQFIMYLAIAMLLGFILKDIVSIFIRWKILGFVSLEQSKTSIRLFRHYLSTPYHFHLTRSTGDLLRTMGTSVGQVYQLYILGIFGMITEGVTIAFITIGLTVVMPVQTVIVAVYFLIAGLTYNKIARPRAERAGRRSLTASAAGYKAALDGIGAVKEINIREAQGHFIERYEKVELENAAATRVVGFLGELPKYVLEILFIIGVGILVLVSIQQADNSLTSIGLLVAGSFRVLPSIARLIASASNFRIGQSAVQSVVSELQDAASFSVESALDEPQPLGPDTNIVLKDVSFRYSKDLPDVLRKISFAVPSGSSVALVGASGAGKSTLVDLILGLHSPTSGTLTCDGLDIPENLSAWRRGVAMVPQDVYLLDRSLAINIAFDASEEQIDYGRIAHVIAMAQLNDLIDALPEGIHSEVGERGSRLSGGQRQRVGIARALYRAPRVLVLDEATSALDNHTEHQIADTLSNLPDEITSFIVAHRLSTVRDVDQLLFLKDGQIAGRGTFDEVRRQCPDFERMVQLGTLIG